MLTIVTYHYVRDLPNTRYPRLKGLLTDKFMGQLEYIDRHYAICSIQHVISAIHGECELPPRACLLTFDDGFIDHYLTVFPRLRKKGMIASFYPSAGPVEDHIVLDVHKVHFILASTTDYGKLIDEIFSLIKFFRREHDIPSDEEIFRKCCKLNRYDIKETSFIKNILNYELPENVRSELVHMLFVQYVTDNEEAFAKELYMDIDQLRLISGYGMEIGGHGYRHLRLQALSRDKQEEEIGQTLTFLEKIYGKHPSNWVMSYPFGSYNSETIEILKTSGCAMGLSTRAGVVPDLSNPMELMRLDTNDLPFSSKQFK